MVKTLPLCIAVAAMAVLPVFTVKAEEGDVELKATEIYSSDMTDWTFSNLGAGPETWQKISVAVPEHSTLLEDMTPAEKEETGCEDGIVVIFDEDNDTNAWAVSPSISLVGGQLYSVSIYVKSVSEFGPYESGESWKLVTGLTDSSESLSESSNELLDYSDFGDASFKKYNHEFTPSESGEYHFGLNCYSESDLYGLYATGFKVEKLEEVDTAVTEIEAASSEAKYFDVNGMQIANPEQNGLYIKVKDGKAVKVIKK